MFVLSVLADTLSIHPRNFSAPPTEALTNQINKKYANKILHNAGMCLCLFDIVHAGEGKVRYGDGLLWHKVKFRMVVFRPFPSEVVLAKVKSSDESGIRLTLGFFDDIHVPCTYLPQPSAFDPNERSHFWYNPAEPPDDPEAPQPSTQTELLDTPRSDRWYIEKGEVVRVRVESDEFYDDEPGPPKADLSMTAGVEAKARRPPYTVVCSMMEQGLGPVEWWKSAQAVEEDEDARMDED